MLRTKLKSKEGASITFALLLFLVCAVVSSVVLAAGTAASGRISGAAKTDQRYYSVTSAAELLKDMINNQSVSVTVEQKQTGISTNGATVTEWTDAGTSVTVKQNGEETTEFAQSIVLEAALLLSGVDKNGNVNATGKTTSFKRTLHLSASGTGVKDDILSACNVDVAETLGSNGDLTFVVSDSAAGDSSTDRYALTIVFSASKKQNNSTRKKEGTPVANASGGYTINVTKTDTEQTELTWTVKSIETAAAQTPASSDAEGSGSGA